MSRPHNVYLPLTLDRLMYLDLIYDMDARQRVLGMQALAFIRDLGPETALALIAQPDVFWHLLGRLVCIAAAQ